MNLPNALTCLRLGLVPVFACLYLNGAPKLALITYLAACFTDWLDGYLARKLNQITNFGKLFDPLADKLMQITMLCCLVWSGEVPLWVLIVLAARELLMILGSGFMLKKHIVVCANFWGKLSTVLLMAAIVLVFPWHGLEGLYVAGRVLLCVAVAAALISTAVYGIDAGRQLRARSAQDG